MFFWTTTLLFLIIFLLYPKKKEKQNLLVWLPAAILTYECQNAFWAGLLTILRIPAHTYSVALCTLLVCLIGGILIFRRKTVQTYYVPAADAVFLVCFLVAVCVICKNKYTSDWLIRFETSDPATHLKYAMNFVNNQAVDSMYFGQVSNGLFLESMFRFFSGVDVYKAFLIKYVINLCLAGWIFYAAAIHYAKRALDRVVVYFVTVIYCFGYPLNDMLFGFVYLQLTITVICYLLLICQLYLEDQEGKDKFYLVLMSLGCLCTGVGYTLFAPITFIAILICMIYKCQKENRLFSRKIRFFSLQFIGSGLLVFLVPTFFALWFLVLQPMLQENLTNYGSALNIEGYIYRNLFSDFYLFIVVAVYGVIAVFKQKKANLSGILLVLGLVYEVVFFVKMCGEQVSSYYFYKINYLLWLLILMCFVIGSIRLLQTVKAYAVCYLLFIVALLLVNVSDFEYQIQTENPNYMPYMDARSVYHIFDFNKIVYERNTEISQELVTMCKKVTALNTEGELVPFIGNWIEQFWYEALTNQRFADTYNWNTTADIVADFQEGNGYGKYILVVKGSEEYTENAALFEDMEIVDETDYAFIACRK